MTRTVPMTLFSLLWLVGSLGASGASGASGADEASGTRGASDITVDSTAGEGDADTASASATTPVQEEVMAVEAAFAQTLADRDHDAFTSFLAEDAIFLGPTALRGRQAVADGWKPYFDGDQAPFSWRPETVEVLESGALALSTGPVFDTEGNKVMIFTSIWRLEEPGVWRIVFDRGNRFCD